MKELFQKCGKYILLHFALVLYSFTSVLSKFAGRHRLLSWRFLMLYGCILMILVIYAVLWQQVLKRMPLSTAFANKAVVIIWGVIWGALFFHEKIRWNMYVGLVLIIVGILLVGGQKEDV